MQHPARSAPSRTVLRRLTPPTILALTLAIATVAAPRPAHAQTTQDATAPDIEIVGRRPPVSQAQDVAIDGVAGVIGFDGMKGGTIGRLTLRRDDIVYATDKGSGSIPIADIKSFAIEHSTKALFRGVLGMVAPIAPNGAGQIYSAIRPARRRCRSSTPIATKRCMPRS